HDVVVRYVCCFRAGPDLDGALAGGDDLAACLARSRLDAGVPADDALEVRARAERPVETGGRHLDRVVVEVRSQDVGDALAQRVVDSLRMVDVDAEPLLAGELQREHLDTR